MGSKNEVRAVSVLGVERSGTSLTVNLLRDLGFYVEDDDRPPDEGNRRGYGESRELRIINEEVLQALGGSVYSPPPLPPGWQDDPRLAPLRRKAQGLVSRMNEHEQWAWKHPVLTLTFAFWEPLLPPNHRCLICIRNPLASATSRSAGDGTNADVAVKIWYLRTLHAIRDTIRQPRLIVFYEDYFEPGSGQVPRICEFVGKVGAVVSQVSEGLRHHNVSLEDALRSAEIPPSTKLLYLLLLKAKDDGDYSRLTQFSNTVEDDSDYGDKPNIYRLQAELEYYKRIAGHPYVRLGRRFCAIIRAAKARFS